MHTTKKVPTRRSTLWIGQTCNAKCYFCYYKDIIANPKHPEHPFMSLEKAKQICTTLRTHFEDTSVDIEGGEPTIYKDILPLIHHCSSIGLQPTLITNALILHRDGLLEQYRDAGLRDFLVSFHGFGKAHDEAVCVEGASERIFKSVQRMSQLQIPFRINCTMSKPVIKTMMDVAKIAVDYSAPVVNFIAFNPFGNQSEGRNKELVPTYTEIQEQLREIIPFLESRNVEVNVRYFPLCALDSDFRKNIYTYYQLPFDMHEWNYFSWSWTERIPQRTASTALEPPTLNALSIQHRIPFLYRDAQRRGLVTKYQKCAACNTCAARKICDGFHADYGKLFGTTEILPIRSTVPIKTPTFYIANQTKFVEEAEFNAEFNTTYNFEELLKGLL